MRKPNHLVHLSYRIRLTKNRERVPDAQISCRSEPNPALGDPGRPVCRRYLYHRSAPGCPATGADPAARIPCPESRPETGRLAADPDAEGERECRPAVLQCEGQARDADSEPDQR